MQRAKVMPRAPLDAIAATLNSAVIVIGLDTGLTHLAAALGRPTIGIFCDTTRAWSGWWARGRLPVSVVLQMRRQPKPRSMRPKPYWTRRERSAGRLHAARVHRDAVRRAVSAVAIASPAGIPAALGRALRLGAPARSGGRAGHLICGVARRDTGGATTDRRTGGAISGASVPADPYDADGPRRRSEMAARWPGTCSGHLVDMPFPCGGSAQPRPSHRSRHGN